MHLRGKLCARMCECMFIVIDYCMCFCWEVHTKKRRPFMQFVCKPTQSKRKGCRSLRQTTSFEPANHIQPKPFPLLDTARNLTNPYLFHILQPSTSFILSPPHHHLPCSHLVQGIESKFPVVEGVKKLLGRCEGLLKVIAHLWCMVKYA